MFVCPYPHVITYPFAIKSTHFPPSSSHCSKAIVSVVVALLSAMASSSVPPSPHGSHFVAINPNIDTLNSTPLADGSPDLLFAVFGRGSVTDLNTLLVYAQESLDVSIIYGRRTWMVLQNDGMVTALMRYFPIAHATLVQVQSPTAHHLRFVSPRTSSSSLTSFLNLRCLSHLPGLVVLLISDQPTLVNALNLFAACGLRSILTLERGGIVLHIVERPSFCFTALSSKSGPPFGVPTSGEFREMWKAWDLVTLGMIPSHLLHIKPIDLRHKCLFYLGHIPTWVHFSLRELYA